MTNPLFQTTPDVMTTALGVFEYCRTVENLHSDIKGLNDAVTVNTRLKAAQDVVRDYGVDKPRMKLLSADSELGLSDQVDCPAVEAFDLIAATPKDHRTQAVSACLDAAVMSEKALLASWLDVVTPSVETLLVSIRDNMIPTLKSGLASCYTAVTERDAVAMTCPEVKVLVDGLEKVGALLADLAPIDPDLLIVDTDYRNTLKASFETLSDTCGETLGVQLSKSGFLEFKPVRKSGDLEVFSAEALGYTRESTISLLEHAASVVDRLGAVADTRDAIMRGMDTASVALDAVEGMESYTLVDHKNALAGYTTLLTATLTTAVDLITQSIRAANEYQTN